MTPRRTCIGCRRVRPQDELVRVARTAQGELVLSRRQPGRGAWLCPGSPVCLAAAERRGGFARALRASVSAEAVATLRERLGA
ncbi:MAG: YlxR family protein [Actinobacteria bacterium]|nr:MAG: YlxR family protein [Actinomycetota bacterium]